MRRKDARFVADITRLESVGEIGEKVESVSRTRSPRRIRNPVNWIRVAEICISLRSFGEGRKDEFRS